MVDEYIIYIYFIITIILVAAIFGPVGERYYPPVSRERGANESPLAINAINFNTWGVVP